MASGCSNGIISDATALDSIGRRHPPILNGMVSYGREIRRAVEDPLLGGDLGTTAWQPRRDMVQLRSADWTVIDNCT